MNIPAKDVLVNLSTAFKYVCFSYCSCPDYVSHILTHKIEESLAYRWFNPVMQVYIYIASQ